MNDNHAALPPKAKKARLLSAPMLVLGIFATPWWLVGGILSIISASLIMCCCAYQPGGYRVAIFVGLVAIPFNIGNGLWMLIAVFVNNCESGDGGCAAWALVPASFSLAAAAFQPYFMWACAAGQAELVSHGFNNQVRPSHAPPVARPVAVAEATPVLVASGSTLSAQPPVPGLLASRIGPGGVVQAVPIGRSIAPAAG